MAVLDYLAGKGSLRKICEQYKIRSSRQLEGWVKMYNGHEDFKEPVGGSHMTKGRETTIDERLEIVRECIAGGNYYSDTALKYQVSYQQVYSWMKKYREMGKAGLLRRLRRNAGTAPGAYDGRGQKQLHVLRLQEARQRGMFRPLHQGAATCHSCTGRPAADHTFRETA